MEIIYAINFWVVLLMFLAVLLLSITVTQTREEFISMGNYNIYKRYRKGGKRLRRRFNKNLKITTKKLAPILKRQIDKLSLISL